MGCARPVQALELEYHCKLCIGPCTTRGEGFYYDAFYGDLTLEEEQYKAIHAKATWAVKQKQNFERIEVTREQALDMFASNPFKVIPLGHPCKAYLCAPEVLGACCLRLPVCLKFNRPTEVVDQWDSLRVLAHELLADMMDLDL